MRSRNPFCFEAIQALPAELLNDGPEVFETLGTSRDILAHFVHDEREGLSGTAELAKVEGAFNNVLDCQTASLPTVGDGIKPRTDRRIGFGIELMQKRARPGKLLAALAHFPPVFVVFLPA